MGKYTLVDLVEKDILQQLQDIFILRSGIPTGISDAEGNAITEATERLNAFCELYTKRSDIGAARCRQCDVNNAKIAARSGHVSAYRCHTGLIDFTAPIVLNDELLGFIVGGQVSTEPLEEESVKEIARNLGIEPDLYWAAAQRVKVVDKYALNDILNLADSISNLIGDMARTKFQLLEASEEVEAAARMKTDFLANMSHEIRTPMNAVIGMADMALREELPPVARNYINQIKSSGKSLLAIINDILDFSKIDSGKMDIISVEYSPYEIFAEVANIINTRIGSKDIELVFDVSNTLPSTLIGDSNRIKQVIINIANNAVKFTKSGFVRLAADCVQKDDKTVELTVAVYDSGIGIKEEDLKKLFNSFQQVDSKRNRNVEGTGLGLAISKNLVELMGGQIYVSSVYEVGSCFSFTVPQGITEEFKARTVTSAGAIKPIIITKSTYVEEQLRTDLDRFNIGYCSAESLADMDKFEDANYVFVDSDCDEAELKALLAKRPGLKAVLMLGFQDKIVLTEERVVPIRKPLYSHILYRLFNNMDIFVGQYEDEEEPSGFTAPSAKVLIVDDNAVNLTVAKGLLKPLNMHVDTADSGKRCLELIADTKYDIIFMDHMMPEMDGVETTHVIRRMFPMYAKSPIIALSANALADAQKMFLEEGLDDFIAKPIEVNKMHKMVRKWLPESLVVLDDGTSSAADGAASADNNEENVIDYLRKGGLEVDKAISMLGSEDVYKDVTAIYTGMIEEKDQVILNAWENLDWSTFTIEVHAVKSSSRQIGALELGDLAEKLEMAGKAQDIQTVQDNIATLMSMRAKILELLGPVFGQNDEGGTKEVDEAEIKAIFERMLAASDDLDISAMEKEIEALAEYKFDDAHKAMFNELKKGVDAMDFEVCEDIINNWM